MYSCLNLTLESLLFSNFLEHGVESIFDLVLCSARYLLRNLSPLISNLFLLLKQHQVFFGRPGVALDVWREEIDPALSTLLTLALVVSHLFVNFVSYFLPLFLAPLIYKLLK